MYYFYLIIALQGYCVYHCYTNRRANYWIFLILFLPVIGSLIYLLQYAFEKKEVDMAQKGLVSGIKPTKKILALKEEFSFSETFENQSALADAYLEAEMYDQAIENYEVCLSGTFQNDFYVTSRLQEAYFLSSRIDKSIQCAETIKDKPKFKKSRSAFLYALALEKSGAIAEAERYLVQFDAPFNRYPERLELAQFYIRNSKNDKAAEVLNEMVIEAEDMSKGSYRKNGQFIKKAKELLKNGL